MAERESAKLAFAAVFRRTILNLRYFRDQMRLVNRQSQPFACVPIKPRYIGERIWERIARRLEEKDIQAKFDSLTRRRNATEAQQCPDTLAVKNAKPGRHADGGGLHLLVKESGARSWVYRFMLKGESRDVGLAAAGPGGMSLSDARDAAAALRLKVKAGIDPLAERQRVAAEALAAAQAAKVAGITFKAVAEAYIAANEGGWRNAKHRQQWRNTLATYVYPVIGELPVADVGTAHVLQDPRADLEGQARNRQPRARAGRNGAR